MKILKYTNCIIFSGGEISDYTFIKEKILNETLIICADSGYRHVREAGLTADILVGDFDSIEDMPVDVKEIIKLPPEKDDTDTLYAVKLAIEIGCTDIEIIGGTGNRLDHTYANIQTLDFIIESGCKGRLVSDNEIITLIKNDEIEINQKDNYSLSVFSYSDICRGVTESGVKYPLENATVTQGFPIGISNEITEKSAKIEVKDGKLLIIQSKIV